MSKARRCAIQDRSPIRPPLKARPHRTPAPIYRSSLRVRREATRRGFTEAARPAVLGDGSVWIRNTAAELFPQATPILHRFHAKEHLSKAAQVVYGDSLEGKPWMDLRYDELDEGHLKSLVEALHVHADQYQEARDCIHHIWKNRRPMRYPQLHKQGFCTSTGVVEAGCKVASAPG